MKSRLIASGFVLGFAAALVTSHAISQDDDEAEMFAPDMQHWLELMQPGPSHELLNYSIGEWETTTRIWMEGPDEPPIETTGSATRRWVLDGRFVLDELAGVMLLGDPEDEETPRIPWQGMGLFGYDNFRNMYVGCWADNMGTHLLTMRGSTNDEGTVFTYYGEMDEPMIGVIGRTVKYQTRIIDEDHHLFRIYDLYANEDSPVIEMNYRRKR